MLGYIYKVTNLVNGKVYIGQHSKSDGTLTELDESYWASGVKIKNAFNKYGYENFNREVLCWCNTEEELNQKEIFFIKEYESLDASKGYNIAEGGKAGNMVKSLTKEELVNHYAKISEGNKKAWSNQAIREKYKKSFQKRGKAWKDRISEALRGKIRGPRSEETRQKLREINMGNKYGVGNRSRTGIRNSPDMNKRISESEKKVIHTPEWNKRVSDGLKNKPKSEEHKAHLRKPKPKFKWLLPDGSIRTMDPANASKHTDWIKLEEITIPNQDSIVNPNDYPKREYTTS